MDGSADSGEIDRFVDVLKKSLRELEAAYPRLLGQLEQVLSEALHLPARGPELRTEFQVRAKRVVPLAVEPLLRGLLLRAAEESLGPEEWLVSLATYLASKPPGDWSDKDQDHFNIQLALAARRFTSLEAMALAEEAPQDGTSLVRVAVARQGAIERETVVAVRDNDLKALTKLRTRIEKTVNSAGKGLPRDAIVAALALTTEQLLAEAAVNPTTAGSLA
jgi:hypothetical protein